MIADRDLIPEVATHKAICGDWHCAETIARGEIVIVYPDTPEKPHHLKHWLDRRRGETNKAESEAERYKAVADDLLGFLGGLSTVSGDWLGRQHQRMRGQY